MNETSSTIRGLVILAMIVAAAAIIAFRSPRPAKASGPNYYYAVGIISEADSESPCYMAYAEGYGCSGAGDESCHDARVVAICHAQNNFPPPCLNQFPIRIVWEYCNEEDSCTPESPSLC